MIDQAQPRIPQPGEVQIVVLLDSATFIGWAPAATIDGLLAATEKRLRLAEADRSNMEAQMALRLEVVEKLRGDNAERLFTDVLASTCLWLTLRHHSGGDKLREGVDQVIADGKGCVVTVSIGETPGSMPGTSWAFMVGDRIHDGRKQLAAIQSGRVHLFQDGRDMTASAG